MKSLFIFFLFVLGGVFTACDKVDDPFDSNHPGSGNGGNADQSNTQRILLEDLTGFRCNNCPDAHNTAKNLANIYGDQLIVVNIHGSAQFSTPNGAGSPSFTTDFRTTEAIEYYNNFFETPPLPNGSINRKMFDNSRLVPHAQWAQRIAELIDETPTVRIDVNINNYDNATRTVDVDIDMEITQELEPGEYFMVAYLVEDSIYDWQVHGVNHIENYLHQHVLRDNLNGTWGSLAFSSGAAGQQKTTSFQYSLNEAWKEQHCEIVAYLYQADSREILQVNKALILNGQ